MTEKQLERLLEKERKAAEKLEKERIRTEGLMVYERQYAELGFLCGIDEVGRGPLAGPVCAAAVILPEGLRIPGLDDSEKKREELFEVLQKEAVSIGVAFESPEVIDRINILQATYSAMRKAVAQLDPQPDGTLNDAVTIPGLAVRQVPIIKGDAKSVSIAAASIIAKVTRDRLMEEYDAVYPQYHFAKNKGYGTAEHIAALREYGPCPIHRRSFIGHFCQDV